MKKRGIGHIEMILSFIIFIAAIGFALYFFSPFNSSRLVETSLNYAFREITQNVSVEIESYSVIVNGDVVSTSVLAVRIPGLEDKNKNVNPRVENETGGEIPSRRGIEDNGTVYIQNRTSWKEKDFVTIKLSEGYAEGQTMDLSDADENFYELSFSEAERVISEERFEELAGNYLFDYDSLKKEFNLPSRVNFAFTLELSDWSINATREIPESLEVFSETERKEVLRTNGETEFADLRVMVW